MSLLGTIPVKPPEGFEVRKNKREKKGSSFSISAALPATWACSTSNVALNELYPPAFPPPSFLGGKITHVASCFLFN